MTDFKPINDAHAIAEVVFALELTSVLSPEDLKRLCAGAEEDLKAELPRVNRTRKAQFRLTAEGGAEATVLDVQGLELYKEIEGNLIEWRLQVTDQAIILQCFQYTRWQPISNYAFSLLAKLSQRLATIGAAIRTVTLGVRDQFEYDGLPDAYDAANLLRPDGPHVTKHAFNSGMLWHIHTGWYITDEVTRDLVLNQLNIESGTARVSDGSNKTIVSILHNAIVREMPADRIGNLKSAFQAEGSLNKMFNMLHQNNKRVLVDTINQAMQDRLSLTVESAI